VKNSRVPGRCGVPPLSAAGSNSITSIISSGTGSGTSSRIVTPRPFVRVATSAARQRRTIARGDASSSSIGTPSAAATLTRTTSDGLPSPDSRFAIVERGTAAAFASASCVSARVWRRLTRLRARCAAVWRSSGAAGRGSLIVAAIVRRR
jgi:hypothetical protein